MDQSKTINENIISSLNTYKTKIAVSYKNNSITYQELNNLSSKLANYINSNYLINKKNIIAINLPSGLDQIISVVAILKLGLPYLPIDFQYPIDRKKYMINNARSIYVIQYNSSDPIENCQSINIDINELNECKKNEYQRNYSLNDLLYILYTSGSTGKPKGAILRQKGVMNMLEWYIKQHQICHNDKNIIFSSFGFDLTQKNILSSLMTGAEIILSDTSYYNPLAIINEIKNKKATLTNCTPSAFYPIIDLAKSVIDLDSLKYIILGGEKINPQRLIKLLKIYPSTKISNTYGPTECSDVVCSYILSSEDIHKNKEIPLGPVIENAGVHLLDDNFNLCKKGKVYLSGICLGDGYINNDAMTNEKFIENKCTELKKQGIKRIYDTGDIAYWKNENLIYIGRNDDQVKFRGNRIELLEIDSYITKVKGIEESITLVYTFKNGNQILVSTYTGSNTCKDIIINTLKENLPTYMIPSEFMYIDKMPITDNFKINKIKIREIISLYVNRIYNVKK